MPDETYKLPEMDYVPSNDKGKANGVASLDASGKVRRRISCPCRAG